MTKKEVLSSHPYQMLIESVHRVLEDSSLSPGMRVYKALRRLALCRQSDIYPPIFSYLGSTVKYGPFSGLRLPDDYWPTKLSQLLGCYELELHPTIDDILGYSYDCIVNVGCHVGYYAVGFLRHFVSSEAWAYDIDDRFCALCHKTGVLNDVSSRLHIGHECTHDILRSFSCGNILLICDIEGGEGALLDPELAPSLLSMDILVELHDGVWGTGEKMRSLLEGRFSSSHEVRFIANGVYDSSKIGSIANGVYDSSLPMPLLVDELDRFLLVWLGRDALTPWLFMRCRSSIGD